MFGRRSALGREHAVGSLPVHAPGPPLFRVSCRRWNAVWVRYRGDERGTAVDDVRVAEWDELVCAVAGRPRVGRVSVVGGGSGWQRARARVRGRTRPAARVDTGRGAVLDGCGSGVRSAGDRGGDVGPALVRSWYWVLNARRAGLHRRDKSAGGAGRAHQHEGGVYRGRDLDGVPDFVPVNLDGGRVAAHLWGRGAAGAGARGGHVVSAGESEMAGAEE
mmetsp:Transcript_9191/g.24783  ORF Transcript_9191/g.24783 Transcript_9191/m.24783 type:complete len:219 (+) Transcript_9191:2017-2673(+)